MSAAADKPILHELDDRGVIHGNVRHIVLSREGRDHDIRHTKTKLCFKSLLRWRISWIVARISITAVRLKVAMEAPRLGGTRFEIISIHGDAANIGDTSQSTISVLVGVSRHGRHVVKRTTRFVVTQEEHRTGPRRALHQRIDEAGDLLLSGEN